MNHDLFCRIQFVVEAYELYFVQKEITLEGLEDYCHINLGCSFIE